MKILIVTPAPAQSRHGNRITALRWARHLRALGHRTTIDTTYSARNADLLLALHARKSHDAVARFRADHPRRPILLALTGTDVYGDIRTSAEAKESLRLADRLIVLQELARDELPVWMRSKVRVIHQSVEPPRVRETPRKDDSEVCVMGHLRPVKDPMRTALAARLLPESSRIRVLHLGAALTDDMDRAAREEERINPRYRRLGDRPRWKAMRILSRCRLLVLTSQLEGGANVIGEALTLSVPVISSRIAGSIGLLGADYPGLFPVGDTKALADLLHRAETDAAFLRSLKAHCAKKKSLFAPAKERAAWRNLLAEAASLLRLDTDSPSI